MKVFRITGKDGEELVAASTLLWALVVYCEECGIGIEEFTENDYIEEVLPAEWDIIEITIIDENLDHPDSQEVKTLTELMRHITEPGLITTIN